MRAQRECLLQRKRGQREGGGLTVATCTSRLGLGALIVRAWRIKLARTVMKAAGGLMTVAERLLRKTCGDDRLSPTTKSDALAQANRLAYSLSKPKVPNNPTPRSGPSADVATGRFYSVAHALLGNLHPP